MKNKSTMLLVGIGVAYLLYRLYAKNSMAPVNLTTSVMPTIQRADTEQIISNGSQRPFLVDSVRDEAIDYNIPNTYQTFYGRNNIAGTISRVPSTC